MRKTTKIASKLIRTSCSFEGFLISAMMIFSINVKAIAKIPHNTIIKKKIEELVITSHKPSIIF